MSADVSVGAQDDGLYYGDGVGAWAEDKYRLVALYDSLFSTGMKRKWDTRVYVDLYAGSGLVRVRGTNKFLWGSPLLALQVRDPFNKYIFCEKNHDAMNALSARVKSLFPLADVSYVRGDCNEKVDEICGDIPLPSPGNKVLSFCFVDPYDLSIKFSTVRRISSKFVDFLSLLAFGMDANRNLQSYLAQISNLNSTDETFGLAPSSVLMRVLMR